MTTKICSVDGCGKLVARRSWCGVHYKRRWRYGDPLAGGPERRIGWTLDQLLDYELARAFRDGNGCWIAQCFIGSHGYAVLRGTTIPRLIVARKIGRPLTTNEVARHTCDVPACINPDHLISGTHADNVRDMDVRNRRVSVPSYGTKHGLSKLTEADVRTIRQQRAEGATLKEIGRRFGINESTVSQVCKRKTWKHV